MFISSVYGIVNLSEWVRCSDGHQYKAVHGLCNAKKAEDVIGCRAGSGQANFIIEVGKKQTIIIPGCQLSSFQLCATNPNEKDIFSVK